MNQKPNYITMHGGTPGASVILVRYKLIEFFEEMEVELYDLIDDVSESHYLRDEMPERNPDYIPW